MRPVKVSDLRMEIAARRRRCYLFLSISLALFSLLSLVNFCFRFHVCSGTSSRDHAIDIDGILEDVEKVEKLREMVEAAVADAEEREIREQSVRVWLHQLRYLCYDMEDVHDLFEYQLNATKVLETAATSSDVDQVPPPLENPSFWTGIKERVGKIKQQFEASCWPSKQLNAAKVLETAGTSSDIDQVPPPLEDPSFWTDIKERVGKIKQQFEEIAKMKEVLGLKGVVVSTRSEEPSGSITSRAATGYMMTEPKFVGRKEEIEKLLQVLKAEEDEDSNSVEVIAIVGVDGVGKTCLAQYIFQSLQKAKHFDVMGWICVSEDLNLVHVTRDVLNVLTDGDFGDNQLSLLQKRLSESIDGRKFFLVVDGMCTKQVISSKWDSFFAPFRSDAIRKGSKIVITTQDDEVAETVRAAHRIILECLNEDDGWSLLQYHAFANPKAEHPGELETIGREIVGKCGGLPLAIKHHGQFLYRKRGDGEDAWKRILKCDNLLESTQDSTNNTRPDGATMASSRPPTGSIPTEKELVGRDLEIDKLVNLIKEEGGSSNVEVIAIVGMGGSGKTSLAQHVFQQVIADQHFDVTAWVFVSEIFDLVSLTKATLNAFTKQDHGNNELNWLQDMLHVSVKEKKLFLVMDDMWNEDVNIWSTFVSPFMHVEVRKGSKILITTREVRVAQTAQVVDASCIKLNCLSEGDAWSLFQQHAFVMPIDEYEEHHQLVDIGKKIARKCAGLPLGIKVLGSSLRNKTDDGYWTNVLESNLWDSIQVEGTSGKQILGPLYLSYLRLPPHLKACFRYCLIFHRGENIRRKELISFWLAHNLIGVHNASRIYQNIANGYIDELISRSFLEYTNSSKNHMTIHDLLFDMLQYISRQEFNVMHEKWELVPDAQHLRVHMKVLVPANKISAFKKRTFWEYPENKVQGFDETIEVCEGNTLRFLSLVKGHLRNLDGCLAESRLLHTLVLRGCNFTRVPDSLFKLYNLRVLDLRSNHYIQVIPNSISNLKNLIYLDISYTNMNEIPEAICALQELAYLDISCTHVKKLSEAVCALGNLTFLSLCSLDVVELPESLCGLTKLEKLNLYGCRSLTRLPRGITELTRLQFLDISETKITCMPRGISRLKRLQYPLKKFHVGKAEDGHAGIRDLKTLLSAAQLQYNYLLIYGLQNITREEAEEYYGSILSHNKHIQEFYLYWDMSSREPKSSIKESRINGEVDVDQLFVLDALRPHINIKGLTIANYKGSRLPTWIDDVSFVNISGLYFLDCGNCTSISSLGQLPSLRYLSISDMASLMELLPPPVKCSGCSTSSSISFPKLGRLSIESCQSIASIPLYGFPSLVKFIIRKCSNLEKIEFMDPSSIPSYESTSFMASLTELLPPPVQFSGSSTSSSISFPNLHELFISLCQSIASIPLYRFPSLSWIKINKCSNLEKIQFMDSSSISSHESASSLEYISIDDCPQLQFSEDTMLPSSLRRLEVSSCTRLENWIKSNIHSKLADVDFVQLDDDILRKSAFMNTTGTEEHAEIWTDYGMSEDEVTIAFNDELDGGSTSASCPPSA